jgi:hypothetical protein
MKYLFFSIFLFVVIVSCKKESEYIVTLPFESNTGQNSLGFLYNGTNVWSSIEHGVFFLYDKPDNIPNATATLFNETSGNKILQFGGAMSIKNNSSVVTSNSSIQFTIQNYNLGTGNFYFDTLRLSSWIIFQDGITSKNYYNYTNNSFSVIINKIDTTEKIVSGKFSGSLYRKNGTTFFLNDSINIQQGRFDIKYSNYP